MLPVNGRQIVHAARECLLFLVRAVLFFMRRAQGQAGRERGGRTHSGRTLSKPLMGLLLVSLLLALQAAPAGRLNGLALSGFGACGEAALAAFANCGGKWDAASERRAIAHAGMRDANAVVAESSQQLAAEIDQTGLAAQAIVALVGAAGIDDHELIDSSSRSAEFGSLARDRDLSAAAVARAPKAGVALVGQPIVVPLISARVPTDSSCVGSASCGIVQVDLR